MARKKATGEPTDVQFSTYFKPDDPIVALFDDICTEEDRKRADYLRRMIRAEVARRRPDGKLLYPKAPEDVTVASAPSSSSVAAVPTPSSVPSAGSRSQAKPSPKKDSPRVATHKGKKRRTRS